MALQVLGPQQAELTARYGDQLLWRVVLHEVTVIQYHDPKTAMDDHVIVRVMIGATKK